VVAADVVVLVPAAAGWAELPRKSFAGYLIYFVIAFVADWMEMYNKTFQEDTDVVLAQQAGLRSNLVPYGRLLPKSESPIRHFHRLVYHALSAGV